MSLETVLEQHDVNKINYGGEDAIKGQSGRRPSEPWDAGEYGLSLATAQARWDAAQTPEAREQVARDLKERAIRRAGLDVTGGKVKAVYANKPAWHELGTTLNGVMTKDDVIKHALNFTFLKQPRTYDFNGAPKIAEGRFDLIRSDNGAYIAEAGPLYTPIQPEEALNFLDAVLPQFGAKYESAGSLYGGKKIWILAHLPQQSFEVVPGDRQDAYALFLSPNVPGEAGACFSTMTRVECANTVRMASKDKHKGIRIPHTGDLKAKITEAQKALGVAVDQFGHYKESASVLVKTPLANPTHYFHDVLDAVLDLSYADCLKGADVLAAALMVTDAERKLEEASFARKIERRGEILEDILSLYESPTCTNHGIGGTVWAGVQACTEYANHGINYRGQNGNRASRRLESIMVGAADDMSQAAYERAMKLAV